MKPTTYETEKPRLDAAVNFILGAIASEQGRLDAAPSMTMEELVIAYAKAREFHEWLDEVRKKLYHIQNVYKETVIPTRMIEQGVKTVSTNTHRLTLSHRFTASMIDKDACIAWLRDNELGDIVTETVNAQTLGKVAEERVKQNMDLPEDLFKTGTSPTTTLTALK